MAVITTSGLVSDIRGSIAGNTFQRSAGGLTVRKKPMPVGRGSNQQLAQRSIIAQLNFLWNNLSDADRQVWSSFAIFNNGASKTNRQRSTANNGKTQFFAVNSWLLIYGKPYIPTPTIVTPPAQPVPCPPFYNISANLGVSSYDLDTTREILVVQVSLPQSPSTVTANTGFRTLVYTMVDGTIQDWSAAYLSTFGVPLTFGKRYWIQLIVVDFVSGAISPKGKHLVLYDIPPSGGIGSMIIGSTFFVS